MRCLWVLPCGSLFAQGALLLVQARLCPLPSSKVPRLLGPKSRLSRQDGMSVWVCQLRGAQDPVEPQGSTMECKSPTDGPGCQRQADLRATVVQQRQAFPGIDGSASGTQPSLGAPLPSPPQQALQEHTVLTFKVFLGISVGKHMTMP